MDSWQIFVFLLFPMASVFFMFFLKRNMLWISPLISTVLSVLYSLIVMPSLLTIAEGSIFWMVTIPLQLVITITFTGIAYIISRLLKKEYRKTNK
jgi:hypothetical protein